ncbi:MAG: S41 family peptidase [Gemmatimonadales bacterium]
MRAPALLHRIAAVVLVLLPLLAGSLDAQPLRFMRDPHIHGNRIAFSYLGDIWVANADGSAARRLTSHVGRDITPTFSPDGRSIAFSSDRFGNYDVFVVAVDGGEPTQLTFHTGPDLVRYWTPDGSAVMFSTLTRGVFPFGSPMYIVSRTGGIPTPMSMDMAGMAMISQDGRRVAFTRSAFNPNRKGYRGNAQTDIYVQDIASREVTQLTDTDLQNFRSHGHDAHPMWGQDGQVYFVSERDGIFNLWRVAPGGGVPIQVTRHTIGGVMYPAISPDGRTIIYTQEFELWAVDIPTGTPRRIPVSVPVDPRDNPVEFVRTQGRAEGFSPDPTGDRVVVDFRGEIVIVPVDAAMGEMTRVTRSPWRDRYAAFSPDGSMLAYVSDESGEEEIWVSVLATGERRKITDMPVFQTSNFAWAPNGERIAFVAGNRLYETRVADGRTTELAHNEAGGYTLHEYSPDGGWLVYSRSNPRLDPEVFLFEIATRRETDVTRTPGNNGNAGLSPDGRTLLFTSNRAGGVTHLFSVSLARLGDNPNDPVVRGRQRTARGADTTATGGARGVRAAPTPLQVDTAGIGRRAQQLTTGANPVGEWFLSADGRTIYFTSRDDDGPGLFSMTLDGRERRKVAPGAFPGLTPTKDRRFVFFTQPGAGTGNEVHRMTLQNQRRERVNFSFTVEVDQRAEWRQIVLESWRVMRDRFYDSSMHGRDWVAIRDQYLPLLDHVGTYEDSYDLANKMIGELNASHVGVTGPASRPQDAGYTSRHLGLELEPAGARYRISHIYREGPADHEWLGLSVGDYVLAIDGQELQAGDNYWRILNHALNEFVPIRVSGNADGRDARIVRIQTIESPNNLKYEEWVARNREFVERESGGRIAYVHIRAMNQPSLARFEEEINRFWDAEGIVVDIRFNGGGNIDQQLLDILERRPYQFWNNRWGAREWGRRPRQAIAGPKVMLVNARSGSDSEVTPLGFKDLGLGRVVGNPTAGAVIATGNYGLIHGGSIRTPGSLVVQWDPTKPNNYGINLENYGVEPDVWVVNSPMDMLAGFDRELKTAVDEALRMLRSEVWQYRGFLQDHQRPRN